jgi:hypothetical protein
MKSFSTLFSCGLSIVVVQEKLAVVELSRDVVRNNAGENQAILIQVRQNLRALREEIEEKRRQVETMKRQLQASTR